MGKTNVRREARLCENDGCVVLTITESYGVHRVREDVTHYRLLVNPAAPDCYRLFKLTHADDDPAAYDIDLGAGRCDCTGALRHGRCKHVKALRALRAAGRLTPAYLRRLLGDEGERQT